MSDEATREFYREQGRKEFLADPLPGTVAGRVFETGRQMERDRILKLLQFWATNDEADWDTTIALIKGENK